MPEERSRESGSGSTTLPTEKAMPTPPPKDNSMRSLVILSTTLFAISFLTTVFKAVSEYAWAKPAGETTSFPITVDNNERSGDRLNIDEVELFSRSTSTGLVWSSITLGLIFSFVALYSARRITRHDPYYCTKLQRLIVYVTLHICYILPLVTFIYLTVIHARSARFSPDYRVEGRTCFGLCYNSYRGDVFDLETWACDVHSFPGFSDWGNTMGRVCVGETAARGLALVIGLLVAAIVAIVERERRLGRRFMTTWKVRARRECEMEELDEEDMYT